MKIGPKITTEDLKERKGMKLDDGRVYHAEVPGVWTDAEAASKADPKDPKSPYFGSTFFDAKGHSANRELAKKIDDVFKSLKKVDKDGAHFVITWRMYPNKDHPRWQRETPHACGCGCGCG
jgi:hypothetical protein